MGYKTAQAVLQAKLGTHVNRAAADIFDGTTKALFNVIGGRILLTHIDLEISVAALDAGANNTNLVTTPTVGASMNLCAALDTVAGVVGSMYSISGIITDAMTGPVAGGGAMAMQRPIIVPVGTIGLVTAADKGTGGALAEANLWYMALDEGAYVTAT